jgi:hypothetical protein
MSAEKSDWRSKLLKAVETVTCPEPPKKYDWQSKVKEAAGIVDPAADVKEQEGLRFKKTIADTIKAIRDEERARQEREAAERAKLEKAHNKAVTIRDDVIVPLLNRLRDDFTAHERRVLPQWQVRSDRETDRFFAEARTPFSDAGKATGFVIKAEASVADRGEFVDLSVECSAVSPPSTSTSQFTSLFEKKAKFPTVRAVDSGAQVWFHQQVAECARLCTLMRMRRLPSEGNVSMACAETSGKAG